MNNVKLLIAGSAFFAMSAQAADRVSIDVKVTLESCSLYSNTKQRRSC